LPQNRRAWGDSEAASDPSLGTHVDGKEQSLEFVEKRDFGLDSAVIEGDGQHGLKDLRLRHVKENEKEDER